MRFPSRPYTRPPLRSRPEAGRSFVGGGGHVRPLSCSAKKGDDMQPKMTAMLIMARERRLPLLEALESCGIDVLPVCNCNEARCVLETQLQIQVVLTDTTLPDGDWREALDIVVE